MSKRLARYGVLGVVGGALAAAPTVAVAGDAETSPKPVAASSEFRIQWENPIHCMRDGKGRTVHIQRQTGNDGVARVAVAPTETESGDALDRLHDCKGWTTLDALNPDHLPVVVAIAEAPPGWYRDEQGRVFQIAFDMLKRFHIGAGYNPAWGDPGRSMERMRLEMGLVASWLDADERHRHNIEALSGDVSIPDVRARGQVFAYELNRATTQPFLRLTTFFGKPRRHDLNMDIGFGLRVLDVEYRPHRTESLLDVEYGRLYGTWALWYSPDMASHLVVRGGAGVGQLRDSGAHERSYDFVAPVAAIDGRFLLDHPGFHQLRLEGHTELPVYLSGYSTGATKVRAGGSVAYELILVAVNDQPVTLRTEGALSYRTDLPEPSRRLDAQALAGVRFSFWAPGKIRERMSVPKSAIPAEPSGLGLR